VTINDNKDKNDNAVSDPIQENIRIVNSLAGIIPDNYTLEEVRYERLSKQ